VADALYLHIKASLFEYKGCFAGGTQANFAIPQAAWDKAGEQSNGPTDPLTVELTLSAGGAITRLPPLGSIFALATLKSAIYYNTYNSAIANAQGITAGVVMRLVPGRPEPEVFLSAPEENGGCVGCHTVSADGTRMIAGTAAKGPGSDFFGEFFTTERPGASYDLRASGTGVQPPPLQSNLKRVGFSAPYPDGSRYVTQGAIGDGPTPTGSGLPYAVNVWGCFGPETSKLYDGETGSEIADSGIVDYAYMPMFSLDGTALVFNQMEQLNGMYEPQAGGHALALMDFDRSRDKFGNWRSVFDGASRYPAWPFFLPGVVGKGDDSTGGTHKQIVFALGDTPDFATQDVYLAYQGPHPTDLWWLDIDSGKAAPLARANGLDASGSTYLPYGDRDAHKNYYPTVSPVAAGGYFWLFFTSKRNYGNLFVRETAEAYPEAKKLWVSAIDLNAPEGTDPSHPAFFLPGQELDSGNIRAFASLEACRPEGESCESGIDCCCGFCSDAMCACNVTKCAALDEKCAKAEDCCDETAACIGGFCSAIPLL
jgi:hypothetical protein